MKIQKINKDKVRVIFDCKELEENNISVQSFLSCSPESQKLIESIISIVNEDLHFGTSLDEIRYDLISFSNKVFIIILTKKMINKQIDSSDYILYKFHSFKDLNLFIDAVQKYISFTIFNIYELNYNFYIKIDLSGKEYFWKKSLVANLSEFKEPILLNSITNASFEEKAKKINR